MPWLPALSWSGALITLAASPWLLSRAWRRGRDGRVARIGGWVALLASMALFTTMVGPMRGIALSLIGLPIPALVLAWVLRERRPVELRSGRRAATATGTPRAPLRGRWLRAAARVLVALPLALAAAMSGAIWMSYLADHLTSGIITAIALVVLLWTMAAWWALADPKPWRPAIGLMLCAVAGGMPLWLQ